MQSAYRFLKATIIGGLVVMVPVVALGAILVWATKTALEAIEPVFDRLPDKSFGGVSLALLSTVLALVGSCFIAGLFAETALIRHLVDRAERLALAVPGYALMKNVGANLIGIEGKHPVQNRACPQRSHLSARVPDGNTRRRPPCRVYPRRAPSARRHAAHRARRPGADSGHVRLHGARCSRSAGSRTSRVVAEE